MATKPAHTRALRVVCDAGLDTRVTAALEACDLAHRADGVGAHVLDRVPRTMTVPQVRARIVLHLGHDPGEQRLRVMTTGDRRPRPCVMRDDPSLTTREVVARAIHRATAEGVRVEIVVAPERGMAEALQREVERQSAGLSTPVTVTVRESKRPD